MHPMKNPSPVQNATPLSQNGASYFYHPAKKPVAKGTRSFLRALSCGGIALSMVLTSAQLPVRQAEAFVSTAAKATATVAAYALGMKHLTSSQQPQEVKQYATEQCIQTLNGASFLFSTHREAIKKAWCGSTAVGGTLDQIGFLIQTVCRGQEKCLANLQKTLESIMKSLGKKPTVNFQPLCAVLIPLFKESIESYCEANGFTGNTAIVAKGPPSKGGNGIKPTSGAKPPSPHFLAGLWARVKSAIEKIWNDCTNPFIRFINPKCKQNKKIPNTSGKTPSTGNGRGANSPATQFIQKCTDWFNTFVNGCAVAYKNYRGYYDRSENNDPVTISKLHDYDYLNPDVKIQLLQLQRSQKLYVISAVNMLVKNRSSLSPKEIEQYLLKIKIILLQIAKMDLLLSGVAFLPTSVSLESKVGEIRKMIKELETEIQIQTLFIVKITVKSANKNHTISKLPADAFGIEPSEKHILDQILEKEDSKDEFYRYWFD
jgi:hypothetical protein